MSAMRKLRMPISLVVVALVGCATPAITLKNESTGQIARCGGDATGSMVGGLIGYNIQKDNDEACARAYEAQGFKRVQ
jgi:hypothetical protein